MKALLALLILSMGVYAQALPALNDYAKFEVVVTEKAIQMSAVEELRLVDYDKPTNVYLLEQKVSVGSEQSTENFGIKADELLTDQNLKSVVQMCKLGHGVNEKVSVKSEQVESCRFEVKNTEASGYRWYAVVPFGIIKEELTLKNGTKIKKQMVDYTFGK
ncbi:MAG: hypothetical protein IPM57_08335 [Oligoflexia bacterium]|nr:hypothetical protein [Oligoflexia bacterium]